MEDVDFKRMATDTKDVIIVLNTKIQDLVQTLQLNTTKILLSKTCTFVGEKFTVEISFDYLFSEFEMISLILTTMQNIFNAKSKKGENFYFTIKLNSIEFIFQDNNAIDKTCLNKIFMNINFNCFNVCELSEKLGQISYYSKLFTSITDLIKLSQFIKKQEFCFSFTDFAENNKEIKFYFDKLILALNNFGEHKGKKKYNININDYGRCIDNRYTLIINNTIKQKDKKDYFNYFAKKLQNSSLQAFQKYLDYIVEYVSEFIIDDSINNTTSFNVRSLIPGFRNNKIYVTNLYNGSLSINVYINNQLFFENILEFIKALDNDNNFLLINDFTFIFTKAFFEEFLMRKENNEKIQQIFNYNIYITDSFLNDSLKFDISITDKKIILINYAEYFENDFGKVIYDFWKIFLFSNDILERLLLANKKFIGSFVYLFKIKNENFAFEITLNGMILKKIEKSFDDSLLNNSKKINNSSSVPIVSLISRAGGVFKITKILSEFKIFTQIFEKHFIENLENEFDFKQFNERLSNDLQKHLFSFLDQRVFNKLYQNLFLSFYNIENLRSFTKIYDIYYKITEVEFSEIILFTVNLSQEFLNNFIKDIGKEIKSLTTFTIFNSIGEFDFEANSVLKHTPFKNTEIINTMEKLEESYSLISQSGADKLPLELKVLLDLITSKQGNNKLISLNNRTIINSLINIFTTRFRVYIYEGKSSILNTIAKDILSDKEVRFKEQTLDEELQISYNSSLINSHVVDIEKENEKVPIIKNRNDKKCLIY
jgi:hypothetical protein